MNRNRGRDFSIRLVCCVVLFMVSASRTQADPKPPTGPTPAPPAAKFSFHSKVSLANLDPDVVEARIGCIVAIDGAESDQSAEGLSGPLNLNAQNQSATVLIYDVPGEPTAYNKWGCVLVFDLASEDAATVGSLFSAELMIAWNLQDCPPPIKELYGLKLCTQGAITHTTGSILVTP